MTHAFPSSVPAAGKFQKFRTLLTGRTTSHAAFHVYGLRLGGAALGYIVQVVLAFFLGAAGYGIFALAWIVATVIAQLSAAGFNESTNRYLPGYLACEDFARARGFVWFARCFTTLVSLAATIVGLAIVFAARTAFDAAYFWPIVIALLCVPFATWTHVLEAVSISRGWMVRGLAPTFIFRPIVLMALVMAAITYFGFPATATTAAFALVFACIGVALMQDGLTRGPLRSELGTGERRLESAEWIRNSLLLIMSQGFVILATNIDVLILGVLAAAADVGVYFAAAKSIAVVSFVSIAVGNAMVRRLSEASALNQMTAFTAAFANARRLMLWPSLALGACVALGAPFIMRAFGPDFSGGVLLIWILIWGVFAQAAAGPLQESLVVLGKQRELAIGTGLSMVLNIVLTILLVLAIGVMGAAIASVIATVFRILYLRRLIPTALQH